jgi:hypothetical protein
MMGYRASPRWLLAASTAAVVLCAAGCSSGRIGAVYVLDDAIVVQDATPEFHRTAVYQDGRVTTLRGTVVPMISAGRWLVLEEGVPTVRPIRTSPMRPEQRLPAWVNNRRLQAFDLQTGQLVKLPNTLENDDRQICFLRVQGDRLLARVGDRYNVQSEAGEVHFHALHLPDGAWEPLPPATGQKLFGQYTLACPFADLRHGRSAAAGEHAAGERAAEEPGAGERAAGEPIARARAAAEPGAGEPAAGQPAARGRPKSGWGVIASFEELKAKGLSHGDWGELLERSDNQRWGIERWEVVLKTPDGQEVVLLRQNALDVPKAWRQSPSDFGR